MAPPSVSDSEAAFFEKENYGGDKHTYKVGDDINLGSTHLNDKFHSAVVGSGAKVLAWQHVDHSGVYKELEGQVPSLEDMGGLTRFRVISKATRVIAFKFTDKTGGAAKQYSLKLALADVGEKVLYSNEDNDFKLVGTMPEGQYLPPGSIYFRWNKEKSQVDLVSQESFPKQLQWERAGPSKFVITLTSTT